MVTVFAPVWQMTPEEFRRVTEVTYLGQVHGTMAALRHMRPRNRGKIIQIGSALAYRGIPLQSAYCGAKHAIRGFTNSLRTELIHQRSAIELTIMELPAVNTPQFDWARTRMARQPRPVAPVVQPEVIAQAVFDAVRHPRREYWIGWSTLKVILGNMVLPGFLDRYLAKVAFEGQETGRPVSPDREDNLLNSCPFPAPDARAIRKRSRKSCRGHERRARATGTCHDRRRFAVHERHADGGTRRETRGSRAIPPRRLKHHDRPY